MRSAATEIPRVGIIPLAAGSGVPLGRLKVPGMEWFDESVGSTGRACQFRIFKYFCMQMRVCLCDRTLIQMFKQWSNNISHLPDYEPTNLKLSISDPPTDGSARKMVEFERRNEIACRNPYGRLLVLGNKELTEQMKFASICRMFGGDAA